MKMTSTFALANSFTSHEQEITRLTWLRLYREFADECRWLARFVIAGNGNSLDEACRSSWDRIGLLPLVPLQARCC
jgi:hypothetical protein